MLSGGGTPAGHRQSSPTDVALSVQSEGRLFSLELRIKLWVVDSENLAEEYKILSVARLHSHDLYPAADFVAHLYPAADFCCSIIPLFVFLLR